jgi:hypothetical protein
VYDCQCNVHFKAVKPFNLSGVTVMNKLQTVIVRMREVMAKTGVESAYWTTLLDNAYDLTLKPVSKGGIIQGNLSNPLAYYIVPLFGDGTRGRSHEFTLKQFEFAIIKGWTADADKRLRGVNAEAIEAGLAFNRAKSDSVYGTLAGRQVANKVSNASNNGKNTTKLAASIEEAEKEGVFKEDWSLELSLKALEKRLLKRGTDDPRTIRTRMQNAEREISQSSLFDFWIVNDDLETAFNDLKSIIRAEKLRPAYCEHLPQSLLKGDS